MTRAETGNYCIFLFCLNILSFSIPGFVRTEINKHHCHNKDRKPNSCQVCILSMLNPSSVFEPVAPVD